MSHNDLPDTRPQADISARRLDAESIRFGIGVEEIAAIDPATPDFTVIGQPRALRALDMAVRIPAKGYNVFATGAHGTGKRTAIESVLRAYDRGVDHLRDYVAVYSFERPDLARVIDLPRGEGRVLRDMLGELVETMKRVVRELLEKQHFRSEKDRILLSTEGWENQIVTDFERRLADDGFTVVHAHEDEEGQADIYPVIDGEAITFDDLQRMLTAGEIDEATWNRMRELYYRYLDELKTIYQKVDLNREDMERSLDELTIAAARPDIDRAFAPLRERFASGPVAGHIERLMDDAQQHLDFFLPDGPEKDEDGSPPLSRYRVNVLIDHSDSDHAPIVFERNPDYPTLFGTHEPVPEESSEHRSGFMTVRAGSLLRASGGYLVLRAEDILPQEESWNALKRTLQYGVTEIRPAPMPFPQPGAGLKIDGIPVDVKVIITGSEYIYELLYAGDEEVQKLFKIPAEFDSVMPRTEETLAQYVHFMRFIAREEGLAEIDHCAMAAVAEYGVRLSEFRDKLSTRFSMIADLIREAHHFRGENERITRQAVERAIDERRFLFSLPEEKIDEQIVSGELLIGVTGTAVGRINGLAVIDRGYYSFGRPLLITASAAPGEDGIINIERESGLSGEIHDKGVYIIAGFLRSTYARRFPLALEASIAFEQSYIEVDGDSASSAEVFALLSSVGELPLRQDIAVTGSINQMGEMQSVGGISEKIEGFYEVCRKLGITGRQGVLIPAGNRANLILSHEVQRAINAGEFHIYAVSRVDEGMEVLTGIVAGDRGRDGRYPKGTINETIEANLDDMARRMKQHGD